MTRRIRKGGNSEDFQLMFLGDVDSGGDGSSIDDGESLVWNEAEEKFKPEPLAPLSHTHAAGYLVYTALLTQSGENAPVDVVLENTLGGTVVWSRDVTGKYLATLAGAFIVNKTLVLCSTLSAINPDVRLMAYRDSDNVIRLDVSSTSDFVDGIASVVAIEIRVYP